MAYRDLESSIKEATEGVLERDKEQIKTPEPTETDYLLMAFNALLKAYFMRTGGLGESNKQPRLTSVFNTFATQG